MSEGAERYTAARRPDVVSGDSRQREAEQLIRDLRSQGASRDGTLAALCERGFTEDEADLVLDGHTLPGCPEPVETSSLAEHRAGPTPAAWLVPESLDPGPSGIGGWLLVFLIGLGISTYSLVEGGQEGLELLRSDALHVLEGRFPGFTQILTIEVALNWAFALATVGALIALVRKKRFAPRLLIALLLLRGIFFIGDEVMTSSFLSETIDVKAVFTAAANALIWSLYFQQSARVRNTFVH